MGFSGSQNGGALQPNVFLNSLPWKYVLKIATSIKNTTMKSDWQWERIRLWFYLLIRSVQQFQNKCTHNIQVSQPLRGSPECGESAVWGTPVNCWYFGMPLWSWRFSAPLFLPLLLRCAGFLATSLLISMSTREWRGYKIPVSLWAAFLRDLLWEEAKTIGRNEVYRYLWASFVISVWVIWAFGAGRKWLSCKQQLWWKQPSKYAQRFLSTP